MSSLRYALVAVLMTCSAQAWAAQCVIVTLRDENGTVIKTDANLVGLAVEGMRPLVNQVLPAKSISEPGIAADCPADLVAAVQGLFDQSCLSDDARAKTAQANGQVIEEVNARCKAIYKALNTKN